MLTAVTSFALVFLGFCYFATAGPCPRLRVKNAELSWDVSYPGDNVSISCYLGYHFKGTNETEVTITCNKNTGQWIGVPRDCIPLHCPPTPDPPTNGRRSTDETILGVAVDYSCNYGHAFPDGKEDLMIICDFTGDWTPQAIIPPCERKACKEPPPKPENASMTNPVDWLYGSAVVYTCLAGFWFQPDQFSIRVKCTASAEWDPGVPSACSEVYCSPPPTRIPNGTYDNYDIIYGTTINYWCNQGFELRSGLGVEAVTCQSDGKWDKDFPSCKVPDPLTCYVCDHVAGYNESTLVQCDTYEICYGTYINQLVGDEWRVTHFHLRCAPKSFCPHEQDERGHHCVSDGTVCHFCCSTSGCNYVEYTPPGVASEDVADFSFYYEYQRMLAASAGITTAARAIFGIVRWLVAVYLWVLQFDLILE